MSAPPREAPIRFGTNGWRGILAEDFTFPRLRRALLGVTGVGVRCFKCLDRLLQSIKSAELRDEFCVIVFGTAVFVFLGV